MGNNGKKYYRWQLKDRIGNVVFENITDNFEMDLEDINIEGVRSKDIFLNDVNDFLNENDNFKNLGYSFEYEEFNFEELKNSSNNSKISDQDIGYVLGWYKNDISSRTVTIERIREMIDGKFNLNDHLRG